jgi:hypothetical protein
MGVSLGYFSTKPVPPAERTFAPAPWHLDLGCARNGATLKHNSRPFARRELGKPLRQPCDKLTTGGKIGEFCSRLWDPPFPCIIRGSRFAE